VTATPPVTSTVTATSTITTTVAATPTVTAVSRDALASARPTNLRRGYRWALKRT
jgi:hypothetical protein